MNYLYILVCMAILWAGAGTKALAQISVSPGHHAQQNPYHHTYTLTVVPHTIRALTLPSAATSIALQIDGSQSFENASVISGKDTFELKEDVHAQEDNTTGRHISNLVIFSGAVHTLQLYTGGLSGKVTLHLLNAGEFKMNNVPYRSGQSTGDCTRPATVGQNVWRAGLPVPAQMPEATQVSHLIIHHSATSNTITDYTNAVRNIYLYHTGVNGWNDIGYNFLIAPDGTIFEGRDGRERIEEDNVLGAHFCAKNRGTMGVCLLGTFTTVAPTQKALASLVNIASWKLSKEALNPLNSAAHPLNTTNASLLGVMAGHRDGCSTECPGSVTYSMLNTLRSQVKNQIAACNEPPAQQVTIYPQPAAKEVFIKAGQGQEIRSFTLYDVSGKMRTMQGARVSAGQVRLDTRLLASGLYILQIQLSDSTTYTRKMIIL